ncbi:hypothetical protein PRO82_001374 [Candidatus Protochlamydia amoebophila]|nr:hypothetical protein [Candidatus Protochlamydia amoebophila]
MESCPITWLMDTRSAKLLNRLGFVIEDYVKNFLLINH